MKSVDVDDKALKVKSVFCFVIAPDMQRNGIATKLHSRVCEDAAADGFDVVESYPNKTFVSTSRDFMGPVQMYNKSGFVEIGKAGDMTVMRKALK